MIQTALQRQRLARVARDLTDAQYAIADAIELWLEARPGRDFNASQIARGVKASHPDTSSVLRWMAAHQYVNHNGRYLTSLGRYSTRRTS